MGTVRVAKAHLVNTRAINQSWGIEECSWVKSSGEILRALWLSFKDGGNRHTRYPHKMASPGVLQLYFGGLPDLEQEEM